MLHNIAHPIRRFFEDYLTTQRNLSPHTVLACRDSLKLFVAFAASELRKPAVELSVEDFTAVVVRAFLDHLEKGRGNCVRTRNARLAILHTFFQYLASLDPRFMEQCQAVLGVPFKRREEPVMEYLERDEVRQIFQRIDPAEASSRRDDAALRMLYNTGVRAQELVTLDINDIHFSRPYYVRIRGKGYKERTCPLWPETIKALKAYLIERRANPGDRVPLFVNAKDGRLSRFGLRYIVTRRVAAAAKSCPTLLARKVGPHTFRHTTAMHLLQSGTDLNMIRSWLGHSSIETTHRYVEIDLDMKRRTLRACERVLPSSGQKGPSWNRDQGILTWLAGL